MSSIEIALTLVRGPGRLSGLPPCLAPLLLFFQPATNRDRPAANRNHPAANRDRHAANRDRPATNLDLQQVGKIFRGGRKKGSSI